MNGRNFWTNVEIHRGFMRDADIAAVAGVPRPTVATWKRNNTIPRGDQAVAIAKAMGVTAEDLMADPEAVKS